MRQRILEAPSAFVRWLARLADPLRRAQNVLARHVGPGSFARCAAVRWRALPLCLAVAGCASAVEGPLFFGDSGKYQFFNCEQLAAAAKRQSDRERELKGLIDKAEQGAGGVVVSMLAYKADYVAVEEDLRIIETTARGKNCVTPATWQSNTVIR